MRNSIFKILNSFCRLWEAHNQHVLHKNLKTAVTAFNVFNKKVLRNMLNLELTKSSQQRKTARYCRTPMQSSIVILNCVANNIIMLLRY